MLTSGGKRFYNKKCVFLPIYANFVEQEEAMRFKIPPEMKKNIKKKIKLYVGILSLTSVLSWGIYDYVTVSRASSQVDSAGPGTQEPASGSGQSASEGGEAIDSGNGNAAAGESGTTAPGTEQPGAGPGEENPGSTTPGTEAPGSTTPGTETPGSTAPGTEAPGNAAPGTEDPGSTTPGMESPGNEGTGQPAAAGIGVTSASGIMSNAVARALQIGVVDTNGGTLNVRSGPGTNYSILASLSKGATVTILGEENGWYKVNYGSGEGYVSKQYIKLNNVDQNYMEQLMRAGFPESYAIPLANLHAQHPSWVFQPVVTGLNWNTVIEKESVLGVNMVPSSANDSWKSTASGAYNWANNKWTVLDGNSWVGASPALISYYMDPRNFLNETYIFQFETLQYEAYQNEADVSRLLAGTFMSGALRDDSSKTYAATFVEAGRGANVNPMHLAARCRQEQGAGTSPLISGTYAGFEGYYNYFNIGAYGTPTSVLYQRGLSTAKEKGWNSVYKSITGGATHLADKYINLGQNTLYFQKFNVTNSYSGLFQHQYMANVQAAESEGRNMGNAYNDKNEAFVFRIPVYTSMPENACSLPAGGNPNNWLSSLAVSGYNLTPAFSGATTQYSMIVGEGTSSVTISAGAVAGTSTVSGTGTVNLNYGSNVVKVSCKAQNGSVREYIINIVRQGDAQVAKGDVNGDGTISLLDVLAVKRHILGIEALTGSRFTAADINSDGKVDLLDCLKVKRHILGYEKIQ